MCDVLELFGLLFWCYSQQLGPTSSICIFLKWNSSWQLNSDNEHTAQNQNSSQSDVVTTVAVEHSGELLYISLRFTGFPLALMVSPICAGLHHTAVLRVALLGGGIMNTPPTVISFKYYTTCENWQTGESQDMMQRLSVNVVPLWGKYYTLTVGLLHVTLWC